jgi:hypothetical protein
MADALVKLLNGFGYHPVWLPETGVKPPQLYNASNHKFIRRGTLKKYIPELKNVKPSSGKLADIEHKETTGKSAKAAVSFLEQALRCLGVTQVPKLDLSFAGGKELVFAFTGVTYQSVDPAVLDPLLEKIQLGAIPDKDVQGGQLHIAYRYAYAENLVMGRKDQKEFSVDLNGKLDQFVNVGAGLKVRVEKNTVVSFANPGKEPAAFAFMAGQLTKGKTHWEFHPQVTQLSAAGEVVDTKPYLVARGIVFDVEDAPK